MDNENKFFSLCHIDHFRTGLCLGMSAGEESLAFEGVSPASFVSRSFDTKERDTQWHRAAAKIEASEGTRFSFSFYASNSKRVCLRDGTVCDLDMLVDNKLLSPEEKAEALLEADFWGPERNDAQDILLHEFSGQYLWFKLTVSGKVFPKISRIRLYYPRESFVRYLPESYQTRLESFFVRFTAIFQSLYLDLDEKISRFHTGLDPATADAGSLPLLAEWIGLRPPFPFREDRMRALLANAAELYALWGTAASLSRVIELLCGQKPYIREYSETDPFSFTVLLHDAQGLDIKAVQSVIEAVKPAHTSYSLVILRQSLILNAHTYIGVNSSLTDYPPARLDSQTPMGIHALGRQECEYTV